MVARTHTASDVSVILKPGGRPGAARQERALPVDHRFVPIYRHAGAAHAVSAWYWSRISHSEPSGRSRGSVSPTGPSTRHASCQKARLSGWSAIGEGVRHDERHGPDRPGRCELAVGGSGFLAGHAHIPDAPAPEGGPFRRSGRKGRTPGGRKGTGGQPVATARPTWRFTISTTHVTGTGCSPVFGHRSP